MCLILAPSFISPVVLDMALSLRSRTRKAFENVETGRLVLKRIARSDLEDIFRIHSDPRTNRYNLRGPMRDMDAARKRLEVWLKDWKKDGFGYWSMEFKEDNSMNGFGGVKKVVLDNRVALNLYYIMSPEKWGKGYATEMSLKAVEMASQYLPSYPVVARVREVNDPSRKVAERAGLRRHEPLDAGEYIIYALNW